MAPSMGALPSVICCFLFAFVIPFLFTTFVEREVGFCSYDISRHVAYFFSVDSHIIIHMNVIPSIIMTDIFP